MYFSGQGKVFIAERDSTTGQPKSFRFVGNVPELKVSLAVEQLEHKESTSGARLLDFRMTKEKKCNLQFVLEDFTAENLEMGMYGTTSVLGAATVTAEEFPDDLVAGDFVRLANPKVSAVVIKDSAGSPVTLTLDTHYRIASADFGTIEILNVASFTQPFTAAYSAAAGGQNVAMFTQPSKERWIRFEGLNTADENKPVLIELYRSLLDPQKEFSPISDELLKMDLEGAVLYDPTKVADAVLGQFGRIVML